MTKKTLTMNEKRIVMNYLEVHCPKLPEAQYALYDNIAKNDQHVADLFKPQMPNINHMHVQTMRQDMKLLLEPARRIVPRYISEIDEMKEIIINLSRIIEGYEKRFVDHEARIAGLEDRYTNPKGSESVEPINHKPIDIPVDIGLPKSYPMTIPLTRSLSSLVERECEDAAARAVAAVVDPLTEKVHPVYRHRKGKHRQ